MKKKSKIGPKEWVVKLDDDGYYSGNSPFQKVAKEEAARLTHKDANRISNRFSARGFRYRSAIERA